MSVSRSITILWLCHSAFEDVSCRGAPRQKDRPKGEDKTVKGDNGERPHCDFFHNITRLMAQRPQAAGFFSFISETLVVVFIDGRRYFLGGF